jgi:hypothetical protein
MWQTKKGWRRQLHEADHILINSGGILLGFPRLSVRAIIPWSKPNRLPLAAPWLEGLLEGETEAIPAVKEAFWGGAGSKAEVYLMVEEKGRLLAVPGATPTFVTALPEASGESPTGDYWSGIIEAEIGSARRIEVSKLYRQLGLLYNDSRTDRGH